MWLAGNAAHAERRPERVREELLKHLCEERIEPPTFGRISRIVASALHNAEVTWSVRISSRLSPETTQRICVLVGIDDDSSADAVAVGDRQELRLGLQARMVDHFCLVVDPLDWQEVIDSGVLTVIDGPGPQFGARGVATSVYLKDPGGNVIELPWYPQDQDKGE